MSFVGGVLVSVLHWPFSRIERSVAVTVNRVVRKTRLSGTRTRTRTRNYPVIRCDCVFELSRVCVSWAPSFLRDSPRYIERGTNDARPTSTLNLNALVQLCVSLRSSVCACNMWIALAHTQTLSSDCDRVRWHRPDDGRVCKVCWIRHRERKPQTRGSLTTDKTSYVCQT